MNAGSTVSRIDALPIACPEPNNAGKVRHIVLVRIESADGTIGWGEAITGSAPASRATKIVVEQELAPLILGRDPRDVMRASRVLRDATYWPGSGGIVTLGISAIDIGLWDLAGKITNLPVYALLGGKQRDQIRAASSIIFDTSDITGIGQQFADLHEDGYEVLKGGWGHDLTRAFGLDSSRDLEIVRTIREAVGETAEIIVDVVAGAGWTAKHAIKMARAFEPYRLYWLEDALAEQDVAGWLRLSAATATPLCTGEKGWTFEHYRDLIISRALDVIMLDPGRAEGITGVWKVISFATAFGQRWNAHSWSSAINTAASMHLAAASPNVLVLEIKPLANPMQHELVTNPIVMREGWVQVRDEPGLGVEVDERMVRRYALE